MLPQDPKAPSGSSAALVGFEGNKGVAAAENRSARLWEESGALGSGSGLGAVTQCALEDSVSSSLFPMQALGDVRAFAPCATAGTDPRAWCSEDGNLQLLSQRATDFSQGLTLQN